MPPSDLAKEPPGRMARHEGPRPATNARERSLKDVMGSIGKGSLIVQENFAACMGCNGQTREKRDKARSRAKGERVLPFSPEPRASDN
jgi:hypothetical protein